MNPEIPARTDGSVTNENAPTEAAEITVPTETAESKAPTETVSDSPESPTPPVGNVGNSEPAKPSVGRSSGPLAARGLGTAKPSSPSASTEQIEAAESGRSSKRGAKGNKKSRNAPRPKLAGESRGPKPAAAVRDGSTGDTTSSTGDGGGNQPKSDRPPPVRSRGKVQVPNIRQGLDDDLEAELNAALDGGDVDGLLGGAAGMADRREPLAEGSRVSAVVLRISKDQVFVNLGGPDDGVVPFEQFETEPSAGEHVEVIVRGFDSGDDLYQCTLPGGAIEVSDWDDLQEGAVVEATVTGTNSGGLEAKVGGVRAFIPVSQVSEYRVEDTSDYVDQKLMCVVQEVNERRGKLVLSHRAVLEREREAKKKEQIEKIQPGDLVEGIVRSVKDFGAFVDLGGLDGLIHVSKLSWERIKHPSEVLEPGQQVRVKVDGVDRENGKVSLSYRDTLENPWETAEAMFTPGSVHRGLITRIAPFGCFVRLAAGVEGLVHISELANHRVSKIEAFVGEGQEVEVKVLSFDGEEQKLALSMKQVGSTSEPAAPVDDTLPPPPEVAVQPQHAGPLRGGNNRDTGGERFGLRW